MDKGFKKNLYKIIGENIRVQREQLGLTQEDVANHLTLTRTSVTNLESGNQFTPLDIIIDIAEVLGIDDYRDLLPSIREVNESYFMALLSKLDVSDNDQHKIMKIISENKKEDG